MVGLVIRSCNLVSLSECNATRGRWLTCARRTPSQDGLIEPAGDAARLVLVPRLRLRRRKCGRSYLGAGRLTAPGAHHVVACCLRTAGLLRAAAAPVVARDGRGGARGRRRRRCRGPRRWLPSCRSARRRASRRAGARGGRARGAVLLLPRGGRPRRGVRAADGPVRVARLAGPPARGVGGDQRHPCRADLGGDARLRAVHVRRPRLEDAAGRLQALARRLRVPARVPRPARATGEGARGHGRAVRRHPGGRDRRGLARTAAVPPGGAAAAGEAGAPAAARAGRRRGGHGAPGRAQPHRVQHRALRGRHQPGDARVLTVPGVRAQDPAPAARQEGADVLHRRHPLRESERLHPARAPPQRRRGCRRAGAPSARWHPQVLAGLPGRRPLQGSRRAPRRGPRETLPTERVCPPPRPCRVSTTCSTRATRWARRLARMTLWARASSAARSMTSWRT
eukprot:scaffold2355_cov382-Prasinococcus_capsulatus_cf.AAC.5